MEVLKVQLLGGFSMYYGDRPILLNKMESSKASRLLQLLLAAAPDGIAKNELIDNLYGWEENSDAINRKRSLNNVIYRLKSVLSAAGLPGENFVETIDGVCRFAPGIPLETDAAQFAELAARADAAAAGRSCGGGNDPAIPLADVHTSELSPLALYEAANRAYVGELLPMNQACPWLQVRSTQLKSLYYRTISWLEQEYRRHNNYMDQLALYSRAAAIYPFDNWQVRQIRCNLEMYRYEEALAVYNRTMEMYARDMGNPPTEEMQRCFEEMQLNEAFHRNDAHKLSSWRTMDRIFMGHEGNVVKTIFEQDQATGAYYCTYPSFVDYCRVLVRNRKRRDPRAMLLFMTLEGRGRKKMQDQMDVLKAAIGRALRKGDTYTRYGNRHYIVMLTDVREKEDCAVVFSRIEALYHTLSDSPGELWYHAAMTQELEEAFADEKQKMI